MEVKVDCWSSLYWSSIPVPGLTVSITFVSIASTLIVDCLYLNHWFSQDQQCWFSMYQSSIFSTSMIDPPGSTVSIASVLITSMLIVDLPRINSFNFFCINHLYANHWSPLHQLPTPQDQQCQSLLHWSPLHQSSIASTLIVDSPGSTVSISSALITST